jgi:phosphate transport system protein
MRSRFDEQLSILNNTLVEMGALCEKAISTATKSLCDQDAELARKVGDIEQENDQKEKEIETLCLKLLMQQQPVAKDLRLISAALKMVTDMERIGDQAADISELTIYLADQIYIKKLEHIPQMAAATVKMVKESIDAFVTKNLELSRAVVAYDDVVDELFQTVKFDLIEMIRADSANGEQAIDLLMIAKYYERIGDHAVNISEWVEFAITGTHPKK